MPEYENFEPVEPPVIMVLALPGRLGVYDETATQTTFSASPLSTDTFAAFSETTSSLGYYPTFVDHH